MPIFLECDRCTACCRWPGEVRLRPGELERIAIFVSQTTDEFIAQHTRLTAKRDGLALLDQADGACEWLTDGLCRINAVKPQQCRDFPNLWNFPGSEKMCRAKPVDVSAAEWKVRVYAATGRDADAPIGKG